MSSKMDYSKHRPNLPKYEEILTRMNSSKWWYKSSQGYAGCKNEEELSNLMGALFYICKQGFLDPRHQETVPALEGWQPGEMLPFEVAGLLLDPAIPR